jgi:hypothetical protein
MYERLQHTPVRLAMPPQACGVRREADVSHRPDDGDGVSADASRCSDLTGLARQMCYATSYGIQL